MGEEGIPHLDDERFRDPEHDSSPEPPFPKTDPPEDAPADWWNDGTCLGLGTCPESQDELNWQQLPLSEIHSPVVVDASSAPHILARYHRDAASCVTVGGDADADLCPE